MEFEYKQRPSTAYRENFDRVFKFPRPEATSIASVRPGLTTPVERPGTFVGQVIKTTDKYLSPLDGDTGH